jgi:hypothetical protein
MRAKVVRPGIAYYDCGRNKPAVHVVTVNRSMPGLQIRLLRKPIGSGAKVHLETVPNLARRENAIVAINGYRWDGRPVIDNGYGRLGKGTPITTTYIDNQKKTRNRSGKEILMGFDTRHTGAQAKLIEPNELGRPENKVFRETLYGSNSSVLKGGQCRNISDELSYKSIVGYSRSHIVFLVSTKEYRQGQLCGTLKAFGVVDAIINDNGPSAGLHVRGGLNKTVQPSSPMRKVAYAVGVVQVRRPPPPPAPPKPKPNPRDVECFVFDDNHHRTAGPSDAIFFKGHHAACIPGGRGGICRKWFGRCRTKGSHEPVTFQAFNDQHRSPTRRADAVYARGQRAACVPDGTRAGACRKWFGAPRTASGKPVTCALFGENYSRMTGPTTEMYVRGPSQVCRPNGTSTGDCRKWFGRCRAR